jgi:hypothetical protein
MIRFIIKMRRKDRCSGLEFEHLYTMDREIPELEDTLNLGGIGEDCYEIHEVIGVEVRSKA